MSSSALAVVLILYRPDMLAETSAVNPLSSAAHCVCLWLLYSYYCEGPAPSLRYTVSLVQWVNRLLPPREAAVCVTVMHPYLQWNRVLLSAISGYIGDPDPSDQDDLRGHCTNNGKFHWADAHYVKSQRHPTTVLPYYNSARCRSFLFAT
jgi:hypothetical protein